MLILTATDNTTENGRELMNLSGLQQKPSTRQNGPFFKKWCNQNKVDFTSLSVKDVPDFFMHLYQNLNQQSSTIEGYRTALVDSLGPQGSVIGQSVDISRLLPSFQLHQKHPKMESLLKTFTVDTQWGTDKKNVKHSSLKLTICIRHN